MKKLKLSLIPLFIVVIAYVVYCLFVHNPSVKPSYIALNVNTVPHISWPSSSESAVGVVGTNIMNINGTQAPKPTASTAKLITALTVLREKPLSLNDQGPILTMTPSDVSIYNNYVAKDGSVTAVQAGEQISEYQMLEGMMLPSANNMADSLAIWAYGSLSAYSAAANAYMTSLGLTGTHIGVDASGFDPSTVSTAHDLVKIGELAMENPVLASIVDQSSAELPVAGIVNNVNSLLGTDNIVGIKTGNTDQAGGVFVGAVKFSVNGKTTTVVTANVGASSLSTALSGSEPLLHSVQTNFNNTILINNGSTVALYKAPWSKSSVSAIVNQAVTANIWGGSSFNLSKPNLPSISPKTPANKVIGKYSESSLNSSSASVSLGGRLAKPSIWWLLTHP